MLQKFNTVCYVIDVSQLAINAELCTEAGTGQFRYQLFSREAPVPYRPVSFWLCLELLANKRQQGLAAKTS